MLGNGSGGTGDRNRVSNSRTSTVRAGREDESVLPAMGFYGGDCGGGGGRGGGSGDDDHQQQHDARAGSSSSGAVESDARVGNSSSGAVESEDLGVGGGAPAARTRCRCSWPSLSPVVTAARWVPVPIFMAAVAAGVRRPPIWQRTLGGCGRGGREAPVDEVKITNLRIGGAEGATRRNACFVSFRFVVVFVRSTVCT